jgi:hypothetical protein
MVAAILRQRSGFARDEWQNGATAMKALAVVPWTCPSCQTGVTTRYCPSCGERRLLARELTLRGLVDQVFESFTNIDGRLLRSVRCLVTRPGALTVAYLDGRRTPYIGPVALFLAANVLFFAAESLTHGLVFTTPLESHLHTQPWSPLAQVLVTDRVAALHTTIDRYAPRFDGAIALHARSLILLMVVSFTALPAIVFHRRHRPFVTHAVFALHLYAFLLLLFCIATAIPALGIPFGGTRSPSRLLDAALSIGLLIACGCYLYVAIGAVYGGSRARRAIESIGLTVGVAAIVLGYRFVLLLITLYST